MKRIITYLFLSSVVFFNLFLISCGGQSNKKTDNTIRDSLPLVKIATVNERSVKQTQEYTATVKAQVTNNIAPTSPMRINQIHAEVGDYVSRGQLLVTMDAANLQQMKLQLTNKKAEFERTNELYKIGGVSKSEWDAMKMAYDVQKTAYDDLRKNTSLQSPISGVITTRNYDNGDLYTGALPILVVEQITPVKLIVNISEENFTFVKKGDTVDIKFDVYNDDIFKGKVHLVYPTIDPITRTFQVEISIDNKDKRVRPGMFARATINFGKQHHVVVPDLAIIKQPGTGDYYVYVYQNGQVNYQKVMLGRRLDTEYELISGVNNNAQVVVAGQARLSDGIKVKVQE